MRRPDFNSLRFVVEPICSESRKLGNKQSNISLSALINALYWFCAKDDRDPDLLWLISHLIEKASAEGIIGRESRNLSLCRELKTGALEHGSKSAAARHIASSNDDYKSRRLSDSWIKRLGAEEQPYPLGRFLRAAKKDVQPDEAAISAAKDAAKKIHALLLTGNSKGRIARHKLLADDFREIGKSELHDEIYLAVHGMKDAGQKSGEAFKAAAEEFQMTADAIAKIYQRKSTRHRRDTEDAAQAAKVRPSDFSDRNVTD